MQRVQRTRPTSRGVKNRSRKESTYKTAFRARSSTFSANNRPVLLILGIIACVVVARIAWLCVFDAAQIKSNVVGASAQVTQILPKRGTIYDRNGNVLAVSVECRKITADPTLVKDKQKAASLLAQELGGDEKMYAQALAKEGRYTVIDTQIETQEANECLQALTGAGISGFFTEIQMKRVYPYGAVAGQVLGFVNSDGEGVSGLELQYNSILGGVAGTLERELGADGTPIAGGAYKETPAQDGTNIVITLDINIQEMAEKKIVEGQKTYNATSGMICATDPKTGEIYAMCSTPLFDSTNLQATSNEALVLKNVSSSYEPGSIMKVLTCAIGEDIGAFNNDSAFEVPVSVKVGDNVVHDDDSRDYACDMTPREILRRSSNIGAVMLSRAIGTKAFSAGLSQFGIGTKTNIDFPGEADGITSLSSLTTTDLGFNAFGQGISVPQIQMVRAFGAIANKGVLTTPHFLLYEGSKKVEWEQGPQACSAQTAADVTDLMRTVVESGTAKTAAVTGYDVAAKTGTGEQASSSGGYLEYSYLASLVGFAPAGDPQVLIDVAFNGVSYLAANSAAPVFSSIMGEALQDLNVAPQS